MSENSTTEAPKPIQFRPDSQELDDFINRECKRLTCSRANFALVAVKALHDIDKAENMADPMLDSRTN